MANRMISYGYEMRSGQIAVIEAEAEIVRRIFKDYCDGKILSEIAQELTSEGVEYYLGSTEWNKCRVSRIIDNAKYIGADDYPAIVNEDDYAYAAERKSSKGGKKVQCSQEIELAKAMVYCGQCGKLLARRPLWRTREKWFCYNGCKQEIYVDDRKLYDALYRAILRVFEKPEFLDEENQTCGYVQTREILRLNNEVNRILNSKEPSFAAGKKLILECAELKFKQCKENTAQAYTGLVKEVIKEAVETDQVCLEFLRRVIERVSVLKSGEIVVRFINGSEVASREEVAVNDTHTANTEEDNN